VRRTTPSPNSRACSSAKTARAPLLGLAACFLLAAVACAGALGSEERPLLTRPYRLYAAPSCPGAVFHWVDSLAGTSAGKTIPAHQAEFIRRFGHPTDEDRRQIAAFLTARAEYVHHLRASTRPGDLPRAAEMLRIFCAAPSLDAALAEVKPAMSDGTYEKFATSIAWFRAKYETIWNDGAIPRDFLARTRRDRGLRRLEKLLGRIVRFYGVDAADSSPPRLALVPVPPGYGTHAQELGNILLLEIRPGDDLAEEASVIVHENSHWLFSLIPEARKTRLARFGESLSPAERDAYALMSEAIPTALGQGVAGRAFEGSSWSERAPWYHLPEVDACAKAIYPLVRRAIASGAVLDEAFLKTAIAAVVREDPALTPRSP
jgi:hypothetical protein